jgi:hypothetical protein
MPRKHEEPSSCHCQYPGIKCARPPILKLWENPSRSYWRLCRMLGQVTVRRQAHAGRALRELPQYTFYP